MTSELHGRFCWHEYLATDINAAQAFYSRVAGWNSESAHVEGYSLLKAGDREVAGVMALPDEARASGASPTWVGYIFVDDVDASVKAAEAKGAVVHQPSQDIPNVGRFAVMADPQGAVFAFFHSDSEGELPPRTALGHIGWNELTTSDWSSAWNFYSALLGWTKDQAMDMGEMGIYQLISHGGEPFGAMMNAPEPGTPPAWLFYINVESVEAARNRVEDSGGKILHGPMEVPDESWILVAVDPQGAMFALVGPK